MRRRIALPALAAALAASACLSLVSSAQDYSEKVEGIFNRIEESKGSNLGEASRELAALGKAALPDIRKGMARADGFVRVAVAHALFANESRDEALDALGKVMAGKNVPARVAAAELAASLAAASDKAASSQKKSMADKLEQLAEEQEDDLSRVALLRGAWSLTGDMPPKRRVREIFEETKRRDVKDKAALALAEMGYGQFSKKHLSALAQEPTEDGRLARAYMKVMTLTESVTGALGRPSKDDGKYARIEEALQKLKEHYYDETKVDEAAEEEKFIEAAVRGLLGSLDPYTAYYDADMIKRLREEELAGHYGGIGARVNMMRDKNGVSWLTISEPIFSGPAYRQGLRAYDKIVEIEGESTANQEVNDLVKRMRGKPGTDVKMKVYRTGWEKEREYTIKREEIQLETTTSQLLPGGIGYVKYSTFGDLDDELKNKGANIETMCADMTKKGMKALILDLRGNSGGLLRTAKRISGMFLAHDTLLLTTKARGVVVATYKAENKEEGGPSVTVPLIVLVDGGSASASEIVAGALKDHKRAVLVGEKTFGKGSVQDLKSFKDGQTAARITIAKWFLPSGNSVEKDDAKLSGVEPDVKVPAPEREFWKESEFERLRADGRVMTYVEKLWEADKALVKQLAESDRGDTAKYAGFDALYEEIKTKAEKDEVRELLREIIRRKVQDDVGKAMVLDLQTDVVLQRGIIEACKKAGLDPNNIDEYGVFAARK